MQNILMMEVEQAFGYVVNYHALTWLRKWKLCFLQKSLQCATIGQFQTDNPEI